MTAADLAAHHEHSTARSVVIWAFARIDEILSALYENRAVKG